MKALFTRWINNQIQTSDAAVFLIKSSRKNKFSAVMHYIRRLADKGKLDMVRARNLIHFSGKYNDQWTFNQHA